ncbi:hypothetical protein DIPPA_27974 [Diplonema papillatum]|nr:hypothetical protein DIPPA_27974 [Diplonema papillatum]
MDAAHAFGMPALKFDASGDYESRMREDGVIEDTQVFPRGHRPAQDVFEVCEGLRYWHTPGRRLWPRKSIRDLAKTCKVMSEKHSLGEPVDVVVPLFIYSVSIYRDVVWALYLGDSQLSAWVVVPTTTDFEEFFFSADKLSPSGTSEVYEVPVTSRPLFEESVRLAVTRLHGDGAGAQTAHTPLGSSVIGEDQLQATTNTGSFATSGPLHLPSSLATFVSQSQAATPNVDSLIPDTLFPRFCNGIHLRPPGIRPDDTSDRDSTEDNNTTIHHPDATANKEDTNSPVPELVSPCSVQFDTPTTHGTLAGFENKPDIAKPAAEIPDGKKTDDTYRAKVVQAKLESAIKRKSLIDRKVEIDQTPTEVPISTPLAPTVVNSKTPGRDGCISPFSEATPSETRRMSSQQEDVTSRGSEVPVPAMTWKNLTLFECDVPAHFEICNHLFNHHKPRMFLARYAIRPTPDAPVNADSSPASSPTARSLSFPTRPKPSSFLYDTVAWLPSPCAITGDFRDARDFGESTPLPPRSVLQDLPPPEIFEYLHCRRVREKLTEDLFSVAPLEPASGHDLQALADACFKVHNQQQYNQHLHSKLNQMVDGIESCPSEHPAVAEIIKRKAGLHEQAPQPSPLVIAHALDLQVLEWRSENDEPGTSSSLLLSLSGTPKLVAKYDSRHGTGGHSAEILELARCFSAFDDQPYYHVNAAVRNLQNGKVRTSFHVRTRLLAEEAACNAKRCSEDPLPGSPSQHYEPEESVPGGSEKERDERFDSPTVTPLDTSKNLDTSGPISAQGADAGTTPPKSPAEKSHRPPSLIATSPPRARDDDEPQTPLYSPLLLSNDGGSVFAAPLKGYQRSKQRGNARRRARPKNLLEEVFYARNNCGMGLQLLILANEQQPFRRALASVLHRLKKRSWRSVLWHETWPYYAKWCSDIKKEDWSHGPDSDTESESEFLPKMSLPDRYGSVGWKVFSPRDDFTPLSHKPVKSFVFNIGVFLLRQTRPLTYYINTALQNVAPQVRGRSIAPGGVVKAYRGLTNARLDQKSYESGKVVLWSNFSSCSKDQGVAQSFALGKNASVFIIKGTSCRLIAPWSRFSREEEWLYPLNSKFQINSLLTEEQKRILGKEDLHLFEISEVCHKDIQKKLVRNVLTRASSLAVSRVLFRTLEALDAGDGVLDLALPKMFTEEGGADVNLPWRYMVNITYNAEGKCPVAKGKTGGDCATEVAEFFLKHKGEVYDDTTATGQLVLQAAAELITPVRPTHSPPEFVEIGHRPPYNESQFLLVVKKPSQKWEITIELTKKKPRPTPAIQCPGATAIRTILKLGVNLQKIDVRNNNIYVPGAEAILDGVRYCKSVVEVYFLDDGCVAQESPEEMQRPQELQKLSRATVAELRMRAASVFVVAALCSAASTCTLGPTFGHVLTSKQSLRCVRLFNKQSNQLRLLQIDQIISLRCTHHAGMLYEDHVAEFGSRWPMIAAEALWDLDVVKMDFDALFDKRPAETVDFLTLLTFRCLISNKEPPKLPRALVAAARCASLETIRLLLALGCQKFEYDLFGETPYLKSKRRKTREQHMRTHPHHIHAMIPVRRSPQTASLERSGWGRSPEVQNSDNEMIRSLLRVERTCYTSLPRVLELMKESSRLTADASRAVLVSDAKSVTGWRLKRLALELIRLYENKPGNFLSELSENLPEAFSGAAGWARLKNLVEHAVQCGLRSPHLKSSIPMGQASVTLLAYYLYSACELPLKETTVPLHNGISPPVAPSFEPTCRRYSPKMKTFLTKSRFVDVEMQPKWAAARSEPAQRRMLHHGVFHFAHDLDLLSEMEIQDYVQGCRHRRFEEGEKGSPVFKETARRWYEPAEDSSAPGEYLSKRDFLERGWEDAKEEPRRLRKMNREGTFVFDFEWYEAAETPRAAKPSLFTGVPKGNERHPDADGSWQQALPTTQARVNTLHFDLTEASQNLVSPENNGGRTMLAKSRERAGRWIKTWAVLNSVLTFAPEEELVVTRYIPNVSVAVMTEHLALHKGQAYGIAEPSLWNYQVDSDEDDINEPELLQQSVTTIKLIARGRLKGARITELTAGQSDLVMPALSTFIVRNVTLNRSALVLELIGRGSLFCTDTELRTWCTVVGLEVEDAELELRKESSLSSRPLRQPSTCCPMRNRSCRNPEWAALETNAYLFFNRQGQYLPSERRGKLAAAVADTLRPINKFSEFVIQGRNAARRYYHHSVTSETALPITYRPSFTFLALLGRDLTNRASTLHHLPALRMKTPILEQDSTEVIEISAATIEAIHRRWNNNNELDELYRSLQAECPSTEIYGNEKFRITIGGVQQLVRSTCVTTSHCLPQSFYCRLVGGFTSKTEYLLFFNIFRATPLLVIADHWETCKREQQELLMTELQETEARLHAAQKDKNFAKEYRNKVMRKIRQDSLALLEASADGLQERFKDWVEHVLARATNYGFPSNRHARLTLGKSLVELSTEVCVAQQGYFFTSGRNDSHNQIVSKPPRPVTFLSAPGVDFCYPQSTVAEASKYFQRVSAASTGLPDNEAQPAVAPAPPTYVFSRHEGWKYFKATKKLELRQRIKVLYDCIFRAAEGQGVRNMCMLPLGLGLYLINLDDNVKNDVVEAYFGAQFELLSERDWGFENVCALFLLSPPVLTVPPTPKCPVRELGECPEFFN